MPPDLHEIARPYTDTAWLFLVVARDLVRSGGRVVLVQPQSLVAARDAAPVRDAIAPLLEGLWWCDEPLFDASVRVCAPVLGARSASVKRWTGRAARPASSAAVDGSLSWSALIPSDTPDVELAGNGDGLAVIATATAGFRDEYYGLQPHVVDEPDGDRPLLVTSGLVDVGRSLWGERITRFGGRRFRHPRVDVAALAGPLARWIEQRLVPKVVVATQTRVVEAAVDTDGAWVPSTPVIAVHAELRDLWRVAAVLTAPGVSAFAMRRHAGAALNSDAIKLSARQVLDVPLPFDESAWQQGAAALAAGQVLDAGDAMSRAYRTGDEVFRWWERRLPRSVRSY